MTRAKKTTTPVTAKVVANVAQEKVAKPTVKQLQEQAANLTKQLVYANEQVVILTTEVSRVKRDLSAVEDEFEETWKELAALQSLSPWQFFKKRIGL